MAVNEKNMTSGSPGKLIITFAIPLMLGNVFQQFYTMADTMIVGGTSLAVYPAAGLIRYFSGNNLERFPVAIRST